MKDLIEALTIFLKYRDGYAPTHCEHDELMVCGYTEEDISPEDRKRLGELSFRWDDRDECWRSFRFGSC